MGKVVYVTSQIPYGNGEVWAINEMSALIDAGLDLIVVPRTGSGDVLHTAALQLLPRTMKVPFINAKILKTLMITLLGSPIEFVKIISWIGRQSNTWLDLLKGIVVMPKSLFLARLLRDQGISHIHAYSTTSVAVVAQILARLLQVPWSFTLHSSSIIHQGYRKSLHAHLESARFVRVISRKIADSLIHFIGSAYSSKIKVVHLGVPCRNAAPIPTVNKEKFAIGTPGGLLPHKGHEYALRASRLLLDQGISNFTWYFYGEGDLRTSLTAQINSMGLTSFIKLEGMIDNKELMRLYGIGEIDIVVLPSIEANGIHEGIPVSLMEAMSFGIPVIATDCGGILELIGNGAGIAVPQRDERAIAEAILRLMNDRNYFYRQAERGKEKIANEFNIGKSAHHLVQLYLSEKK